MKKRLSHSVVLDLPVKKLPYYVHDLNHPGLLVRVGRRGKSVCLYRMMNGRREFTTIGSVCTATPFEMLRAQALKKSAELETCKAPPGHNSETDPTLAEALEQYLLERSKPGEHSALKPRSVRSYRDDLKRAFADLYDTPMSSFTPAHLLAMAENWKRRRHVASSVWFNGLRSLRVLVNHVGGAWPRKLRIPKAKERELPLCLRTPEGRRQLIADLLALGTPAARGCVFVALTGLRRGDATSVTRQNLREGDVLVLPRKSVDRNHYLPLSRQAVSLVNRAGKLLEVSPWSLRKPLLKLRGTEEKVTENGKKIHAAVVCPHDLRRMFKTAARRLKVSEINVELLAGHELTGVHKHYDQNQDLDLLRADTQRISDELWPMPALRLAVG